MVVTLVCGHRGVHRPVKVYIYDGPWPLPPAWQPRSPHSTLDLNCRHCGFAPRPGDDGMRQLVELAASRPGRKLDINPRR
jgi:hypothetical protein